MQELKNKEVRRRLKTRKLEKFQWQNTQKEFLKAMDNKSSKDKQTQVKKDKGACPGRGWSRGGTS